ncbi:FecR family protein [Providencia sp. Me31A]|uniref:FecR family protein n=1 Tax=Providencia sp. Me31A TaxID=3392637 RepID=UPI003D26AE43
MMKLSDLPSEIENMAAMWAIKTSHRELDAKEHEEFQCWVNQSDKHAAAYYRAKQLWALTAAEPTKKQLQVKNSVEKKRFHSPISLSLAASVFIGGIVISVWQYQQTEQIDYQAKVGEIQHITLPDGSKVDLDSGAKLQLVFNQEYRQVNLLQGRAYFTVAPKTTNEPRPFQVMAKNGITQALGTEFAIDNENDIVDVSVYQHSVKVSLLSGQELVVGAGDFAQYQTTILPVIPLKDTHSVAWREGQIIFHQRTLPEIIAEVNRYRQKQIILLSDKKTHRTSGVLQISTLESGIAHLASTQGLSVYEVPFVTLIF